MDFGNSLIIDSAQHVDMPAPIRRTDELGFHIPATFDHMPETEKPAREGRTFGQFLWAWRWWIFALVLVLLFADKLVTIGRQLVAKRFLHQAERELMLENWSRAVANSGRAIDWEPVPCATLGSLLRPRRSSFEGRSGGPQEFSRRFQYGD